MRERAPAVSLLVNGAALEVPQGTTVAAAVLIAQAGTRVSVTGGLRAPLCGMGICFECRVTIDGLPHQRSCQIVCRPNMQVHAAGSAAPQSPRGGSTR